MSVVLLGPQRFDPSVADAAAAIGLEGKIALVTAGWQEREPEDGELAEHLGGRTVNLELHRRADEVFRADPEFSEAYRERQLRFRQLQDFYRVRLSFLIESARVIAHRAAPPDLLAEEQTSSIRAIQMLDRHHQRQCEHLRQRFRERWDPAERPIIAEHRAEVAALIADCEAIAIAGGHIASLLNRLQLFDVASQIGERSVLAWSAGAMAITEQVVIFHDDPPHGEGAPEILDVGLGRVSKLVALPSPETRLVLRDATRMSMYAQRFAPARCLVLPRRAWLVVEGEGKGRGEGALELTAEGEVVRAEVAA